MSEGKPDENSRGYDHQGDIACEFCSAPECNEGVDGGVGFRKGVKVGWIKCMREG